MDKVGVFLGAGGNKVFYVNGIMKTLREEKIRIDHLIGFSSSSVILFAHLFSCHDYVLNVFGNQLRDNKKNFYFKGDKKFPHNQIYKSSIKSIFKNYAHQRDVHVSFSIVATQTSARFMKTKGIISTLAIGIKELGINTFPILKKIFGISKINYDSRTSAELSEHNLINLIMGSSTIYPFIGLHKLENKLILEGGLAEVDPLDYLKEFKKKIIIHTDQGKTQVVDGVLHIFSSKKIPNNVLDYTDDSKIKLLQRNGESDTKRNISLVRNYLEESK